MYLHTVSKYPTTTGLVCWEVMGAASLPLLEGTITQQMSWSPTFLNLPFPFLRSFLSLGCGGCFVSVSFGVEQRSSSSSIHFGHLWISVIDFADYRREVLRCVTRAHSVPGPSCPESKSKVSITAIWRLKRSWWPHRRSWTSLFMTGAQFASCGHQAVLSQQKALTAKSDCLSHLPAVWWYELTLHTAGPIARHSRPARILHAKDRICTCVILDTPAGTGASPLHPESNAVQMEVAIHILSHEQSLKNKPKELQSIQGRVKWQKRVGTG